MKIFAEGGMLTNIRITRVKLFSEDGMLTNIRITHIGLVVEQCRRQPLAVIFLHTTQFAAQKFRKQTVNQ